MHPAKRLAPAILAIGMLGGAFGATHIARSPVSNPAGPNGTPSPLPNPTATGQFVPIVGCQEDAPTPIQGVDIREQALSLPDGAYLWHRYPGADTPGISAAIYYVPVSIDVFVEHVLEIWPKEGWSLGRGERETGEAESVFFLPDRSWYGQFRARAVYCDPNAVEVTLTLGQQTASPAPKGTP